MLLWQHVQVELEDAHFIRSSKRTVRANPSVLPANGDERCKHFALCYLSLHNLVFIESSGCQCHCECDSFAWKHPVALGWCVLLLFLLRHVVADATPRLQTFWSYAKVELKPPMLGEMPQVQEGFNNLIKAARTGKWKKLTVKVWAQGSLYAVWLSSMVHLIPVHLALLWCLCVHLALLCLCVHLALLWCLCPPSALVVSVFT